MLISVNPWADVKGLYGDDEVYRYHRAADPGSLAPHVYAKAEEAYRGVELGKSQTILAAGESGSGKTEACRLLLEYISIVSLTGGKRPSSSEELSLSRKVLLATPLLEALGNAKTAINNNSSRFGRHTRLFFDRSRKICGATIQAFLLEKARTIHQEPGARNYHIFYQLLRGADDALLAELGLAATGRDPRAYRYLAAGDSAENIPGCDDRADFSVTTAALATFGIGLAPVATVVAAVLHLGNVAFEVAASADGLEASRVADASAPALARVAALLGVDAAELAASLTSRRMSARGEVLTKALSVSAAGDARDALAKALYERFFFHLVERVNDSIRPDPAKHVAGSATIGLLDIFGFENFASNGFEQFLINYANEMVQALFNRQIFAVECSLYAREGISFSDVDPQDNSGILDLIEKSAITLLDEECKRQNGSDKDFCLRLHSANSSDFLGTVPSIEDSFLLRHYADSVVYRCKGFVGLNRDALHPDLTALLSTSSAETIAALFKPSATTGQYAVTSKIKKNHKNS